MGCENNDNLKNLSHGDAVKNLNEDGMAWIGKSCNFVLITVRGSLPGEREQL